VKQQDLRCDGMPNIKIWTSLVSRQRGFFIKIIIEWIIPINSTDVED
jgi:hypothetical protein